MKATLLLWPLLFTIAVTACGDDDYNPADPYRREARRQIGGVAELAINAYASAGPEALFDYLSAEIAQRCSADSLAAALADEAPPTGFRQLKDVDFGFDAAIATITISTDDGERDIVWLYVSEEGSWRINDMPGLENCPS